MNLINGIFTEQFTYSLGWTLIHSLWLGALAGLLTALVMLFLQRHTARLRYNIYMLSLSLFAAMALLTFMKYYLTYEGEASPRQASVYLISSSQAAALVQDHSQVVSDAGPAARILATAGDYCRQNIPLFVTIWFMGMLAFLLRFMGGYALVKRYRYHRTRKVGREWEQRFLNLSVRLGVRRKVQLLESALVRVPMVIGYLKPAVLLPLGALNGVPVAQMEAILAHELAHILRRDYFVNMVQSLLEVIFFYHPVVWWLSGNIRTERENTCDDIAITITGNNMEFAKALTRIQEINLAAPGLAAGLGGKNKNQLINRICRILGKKERRAGFGTSFIPALILMISLVGFSAAAMYSYPFGDEPDPFMNFEEPQVQLEATFAGYPAVMPDTTRKQPEEKRTERMIIVKNDTTELSEEQKEKIREVRAVMEAEREAIEEQIRTAEVQMEAYREMLKDLQADQEVDVSAFEESMEAYRESVMDRIRDIEEYRQQALESGEWHMPEIYFPDGKIDIPGLDSTVWHYRYPGKYIYMGDSIREVCLDNWKEYSQRFVDAEAFINQERLMNDMRQQFDDLALEYRNFGFEVPDVEQFRYYHTPDIPDFDYFVPDKARRVITGELRSDGLISHGREYMVVIGEKQMHINGNKQPRQVFRKYSRLVESLGRTGDDKIEREYKIFIGY